MSLCKCWVQGKKNHHALEIRPFRPNSVLEYARRIPVDFDGLCMNTFDRRISPLEFPFFSEASCLALTLSFYFVLLLLIFLHCCIKRNFLGNTYCSV